MVAVEVPPLPMGTWGAFQFTFLLVHSRGGSLLCQKNVTSSCNLPQRHHNLPHCTLGKKSTAPLLNMCL